MNDTSRYIVAIVLAMIILFSWQLLFPVEEQIISNDSILRTDYEGFGEVRQAKPAAHFSETPSEISKPAPKLGEHTLEILSSIKYSDEDKERLINEGVVAAS